MALSIREVLQRMHQQLGHSIVLPTPPACERIITQARAAGIALGTVYIISRPLEPGSPGSYDRATGDIWCVYDASLGEAGQREVLHTLLMLIAAFQHRFPIPTTIHEEWEQVYQEIEGAYHLAQVWGLGTVLTEEDLQSLLTQAVRLAACYCAAADLAGHRDPALVRHAYTALNARRTLFPALADEDVFASALAGTSLEDYNDALVDFERSCLRERWVATSSRTSREPASFGDLALPRFPSSAAALRRALVRAACLPPPEDVTPLVFRQVRDEEEMAGLLRLVNRWLIETFPTAALRLHCQAYGDTTSMVAGAARLYCLRLSYEDAPDVQQSGSDRVVKELWVLFSERRLLKRRALEGAWQRFLISWLTWSDVQGESLTMGLHTLWSRLDPSSVEMVSGEMPS
ncbi:MAG TPA: hypothetical protein VHD63_28835 [Ktedonobacteraceae bacterium]|nr:hypothetical protein [Ktedonobacteraceae bacterium]